MKLRKGKINIFFLVLFLHSDSLGNLNGFKYLTYIAMWLKLFCWFSTSLPPHLRPVLSSRTLSVVFPYQLHERGLKKLQANFFFLVIFIRYQRKAVDWREFGCNIFSSSEMYPLTWHLPLLQHIHHPRVCCRYNLVATLGRLLHSLPFYNNDYYYISQLVLVLWLVNFTGHNYSTVWPLTLVLFPFPCALLTSER